MAWRLAVAALEKTDGMGSTVLVARIADVEVVGSFEVLVIVRDGCLGFLYLLGICKRGFIIVEKRVDAGTDGHEGQRKIARSNVTVALLDITMIRP